MTRSGWSLIKTYAMPHCLLFLLFKSKKVCSICSHPLASKNTVLLAVRVLVVKFATTGTFPFPGRGCFTGAVLDLPFPMDLDLFFSVLCLDPAIPLPLPLLPSILLPFPPFPFIMVFLLLGVVGVSLLDGSVVVVDGVWMIYGGILGDVIGTVAGVGTCIGELTIGALVAFDVGDLGACGCVIGVTTGGLFVGDGAVVEFLDDGIGSAVGALIGNGTGLSVS
jgi:hypothetical protein